MEKLEQILQKKNKKQKELFTKAIELGNKAQAIYEEKEELLNKELEKTSIQFKERDTEYQDFLTKPSGENEISQDIITLYEKLGDSRSERILKKKIEREYNNAKKESSGKIESKKIYAGTIVKQEEDLTRIYLTIKYEDRTTEDGIIESLIEEVTLTLDDLLKDGENFSIAKDTQYLQIEIPGNKKVYSKLKKISPPHFQESNVEYICVNFDAIEITNNQKKRKKTEYQIIEVESLEKRNDYVIHPETGEELLNHAQAGKEIGIERRSLIHEYAGRGTVKLARFRVGGKKNVQAYISRSELKKIIHTQNGTN